MSAFIEERRADFGVELICQTLLASADAEGAVQEAVFFSVADLLCLEVDLLFFDRSSTTLPRPR